MYSHIHCSMHTMRPNQSGLSVLLAAWKLLWTPPRRDLLCTREQINHWNSVKSSVKSKMPEKVVKHYFLFFYINNIWPRWFWPHSFCYSRCKLKEKFELKTQSKYIKHISTTPRPTFLFLPTIFSNMSNHLSAFLSKFHWSVFLHSYILCCYYSAANKKFKDFICCPSPLVLFDFSVEGLWSFLPRASGASRLMCW